MQAKDIPDRPVLAFLALRPGTGHNWAGPEYPNSVTHAMPAGTPEKVVLAKMRALIRRGLVDGCTCGCRGDFEITDKGLALVTVADLDAMRAIAPKWFVCRVCGAEQHYAGACFKVISPLPHPSSAMKKSALEIQDPPVGHWGHAKAVTHRLAEEA